MTRTVIYRYLGTNGIIESPIHLEDTYYIRFIRLFADKGCVLTDGKVQKQFVQCSEDEEKKWKEIQI